jgi:Leucine-rich repeat (LRR) protein
MEIPTIARNCPLRPSVIVGEPQMNRNRIFASLAIAVVLAGPVSAASPFADKNLEAAVRKVLLDAKGDLSDEMLKNVYILEATGKNIKDLSGLEKCINLASLRLDKNQIVDLKALKGLVNLQSLDLSHNQISDISPVAGLTKLQYIELSGNKIIKIDALKNLTALASLYLSENQIGDLTPIEGLTKLSSLSLAKNKIINLTPLAKVNHLMTLDLKDNDISIITPLKSQGELSMLMLERNKITDLAPLVEAVQADAKGPKRFAPFLRLWLAGNPLSPAAKTKQLADLKAAGVRLEDSGNQ